MSLKIKKEEIMKKITIMVVAMMMLFTLTIHKTSAADETFEKDGLTYQMIGENNVSVIGADKTRTSYNIPQTIEYNDVMYTVVSLGDHLFYDNVNPAALVSITLPETITSIGTGAFQNCKQLKSVKIPDEVKIIENYTFQDCLRLENIQLSHQLTEIKSNAFYHCAKLEAIALPDSVKKIADNVFIDCHSLKSIVIPKNVESLGASSLWYCTNLESVTLSNKIANIKDTALQHSSKLSKIMVITDTKDEIMNPQILAAVNKITNPHQIYRGVTHVKANQSTIHANRGQTLDLDSYFDKTFQVYDENNQLSSAMMIPSNYQNVEYQLIGTHFPKTQISGHQIKIGDDETNSIQIKANLNGYSDTLTVDVLEITITNIEIDEKPEKTTYFEGEFFNPEGLKIKVHYSDGTYKIVTYNQDSKANFSFSHQDPLKTTDNKIIMKYAQHLVEFNIEVQAKDVINDDNQEDQTIPDNKPQEEPVQKPESIENDTPKTEDQTMILGLTLLMIVSGAIVFIKMKKQSYEI